MGGLTRRLGRAVFGRSYSVVDLAGFSVVLVMNVTDQISLTLTLVLWVLVRLLAMAGHALWGRPASTKNQSRLAYVKETKFGKTPQGPV